MKRIGVQATGIIYTVREKKVLDRFIFVPEDGLYSSVMHVKYVSICSLYPL